MWGVGFASPKVCRSCMCPPRAASEWPKKALAFLLSILAGPGLVLLTSHNLTQATPLHHFVPYFFIDIVSQAQLGAFHMFWLYV